MIKFAVRFALVFGLASANQNCNALFDRRDPQVPSTKLECVKAAKEQIGAYFIVPGVGVGNMKLGASMAATLNAIEACPPARVVNYHDNKYQDAEISIADQNLNTYTMGEGMRLYFKADKLFQIKVHSFLYSNQEVTKDTLMSEVRAKYPDGELFKLIGSANINDRGSKDLIYYIVKGKGIAFEFYSTKFGDRKVSNIYLFESNTEFFPLGNLNAPEFTKLIKLRP